MTNRLHKSSTNKVIAGVCGGLGEYFDIDPTLVRLVFVLLLINGISVLAYIVLWIVMPQADSEELRPHDYMRENLNSMSAEARRFGSSFRGTPDDRPTTGEEAAPIEVGETGVAPADTALSTPSNYTPRRAAGNRQFLAGAILLALGVIFLLDSLHIFWWFNWGRMWPLILIALGAFLLYDRSRPRR